MIHKTRDIQEAYRRQETYIHDMIHKGDIQGHTGDIKETNRGHTRDIHETHRGHTGDIQRTYWTHYFCMLLTYSPSGP